GRGRRAIPRRGLAAGMLERVHLAVQDCAPLLDSAVVPAADDPARRDDHRPDGDTAFAQSLLGLGDGGGQERIAAHACGTVLAPALALIASYSKILGP